MFSGLQVQPATAPAPHDNHSEMITPVRWRFFLQRLLQKRKRLLREKRGFIRLGTIGFGSSFALAELWVFRAYSGIGFWLFVLVVSFAVAWGWASMMWHVYQSTVLKGTESDSRKPDSGE